MEKHLRENHNGPTQPRKLVPKDVRWFGIRILRYLCISDSIYKRSPFPYHVLHLKILEIRKMTSKMGHNGLRIGVPGTETRQSIFGRIFNR